MPDEPPIACIENPAEDKVTLELDPTAVGEPDPPVAPPPTVTT
jgi:hypothetical protein